LGCARRQAFARQGEWPWSIRGRTSQRERCLPFMPDPSLASQRSRYARLKQLNQVPPLRVVKSHCCSLQRFLLWQRNNPARFLWNIRPIAASHLWRSERNQTSKQRKKAHTNMKPSKAVVAGAAVARLFTGSVAARAYTATASSYPGVSLQTLADAKKSLPGHSCKGQNNCKGQGGGKDPGGNSCKGKGGCATDGSKPK
jgi:hypothetical protein